MKKLIALSQHTFTLALILWMVVPNAAHAYLDPNTGSSIIQIGIASLATGSYLVKVFWKQISGFFKGLFGGNKTKQTSETTQAPANIQAKKTVTKKDAKAK